MQFQSIIKQKYFIKILSLLLLSLAFYSNFSSKYFLNNGSYDDLFMYYRSSQFLEDFDRAKKTLAPDEIVSSLSKNKFLDRKLNLINDLYKTYGISYLPYVFLKKIFKTDNILYNIIFLLTSSFSFILILTFIVINKFEKSIFGQLIKVSLISAIFYFIFPKLIPRDLFDANLFYDFSLFNLFKPLVLLFSPGAEYHYFGITPRNHFILFNFIVFMLRWKGHIKVSYYFLFLGSLLHNSMAFLLFSFIFTTDLIKSIFYEKIDFNYFPIILIISSFFFRSELLLNLTQKGNSALLLIFIIVLIPIIKNKINPAMYFNIELKNKIKTFYKDKVNSDIISFFLLWFLSIPLMYKLYLSGDTFSKKFLWGQIPGRLIATMHGPFIFFLLHNYKSTINKVFNLYVRNKIKIFFNAIILSFLCYFLLSGLRKTRWGYYSFNGYLIEYEEKRKKAIEKGELLQFLDTQNGDYILYSSIISFNNNTNLFEHNP